MNSIIHQITKSATPKIGTPATFLSFSDRNPGVVVKINSPKSIDIAHVDTIVKPNPNSKDGSYPYGAHIEYEYKIDLSVPGTTYTLRKNGNWQMKGCALRSGCGKVVLGYMEKYFDPSF
jgi:hypothetical protein